MLNDLARNTAAELESQARVHRSQLREANKENQKFLEAKKEQAEKQAIYGVPKVINFLESEMDKLSRAKGNDFSNRWNKLSRLLNNEEPLIDADLGTLSVKDMLSGKIKESPIQGKQMSIVEAFKERLKTMAGQEKEESELRQESEPAPTPEAKAPVSPRNKSLEEKEIVLNLKDLPVRGSREYSEYMKKVAKGLSRGRTNKIVWDLTGGKTK